MYKEQSTNLNVSSVGKILPHMLKTDHFIPLNEKIRCYYSNRQGKNVD